MGRETLLVREPGGTPAGEAIRNLLQYDAAGEGICPETEALLFAASRAQLVRSVILPAIENGVFVLSDRFADSTTAYQGYGRGLGMDTILRINELAVNGAEPDLTLLLDIDVSRGFERLQQRNSEEGSSHDRFEREKIDFHERMRAGYREMAEKWPERIKVIDADADLEEVELKVKKTVEAFMRATGRL